MFSDFLPSFLIPHGLGTGFIISAPKPSPAETTRKAGVKTGGGRERVARCRSDCQNRVCPLTRCDLGQGLHPLLSPSPRLCQVRTLTALAS